MSLWRLEWLRLTRTPRAIALAAVFVVVGLIEPVATKYQDKLLAHVGNGIRIYVPPPTPAAGLSSYVSEVTLVGLIVVVVLAAGAFSFDARRGLATFLRTRIGSIWQLLVPRYVVCAAAAAIAYLLGTLAAWYETDLLIGPLPVAGMLAGIVCGAAYLALAVALTALAAALVRGTLAAVGSTLALLLLLPLAGTYSPTADWLPSALANAPVSLVNGTRQLPHYLPALAVAAALSAAALVIAAVRLRNREI